MSKLAEIAKEGVEDAPWAPVRNGLCQQFVRECLEHAHGSKVSEKIRAGSAKNAAQLWLNLGWGFRATELTANGGIREGDVLYKTSGSGGYGHVGIVVKSGGRWAVAENSSTQYGRVRGALGYRTLSQFGGFNVVGRLPASITGEAPLKPTGDVAGDAKEPRLILAVKTSLRGEYKYFHLKTAKLKDGHFKDWRRNINKTLNLVGELPDAPTPNIPDYLVKQFGFKLAKPIKDGDHLKDREDPRQYVFLQAPKGWKAAE